MGDEDKYGGMSDEERARLHQELMNNRRKNKKLDQLANVDRGEPHPKSGPKSGPKAGPKAGPKPCKHDMTYY